MPHASSSLPARLRVGLLADTHGLLRPEALAFLRGSDHIVHAGDICDPDVLHQLRELAPVTAVRGNCDQGDWARFSKRLAHPSPNAIMTNQITLEAAADARAAGADAQREGLATAINDCDRRAAEEKELARWQG